MISTLQSHFFRATIKHTRKRLRIAVPEVQIGCKTNEPKGDGIHMSFPLPKNFTVTAHTGCEGTQENSLASIKKAFACGADVTEIDLQYASDSTPVLSHNTPNGGEPTLAEAFETLKNCAPMRMNIDVKSTAHLETVALLAAEYGVSDRIFYTGVRKKDVAAVRAKTPSIPYYLNISLPPRALQTQAYCLFLAAVIKRSGAVGINCHYGNISKALIKTLHRHGYQVSVWTVNEEAQLRRILSLSPDNITTRNPSLAKRIIG